MVICGEKTDRLQGHPEGILSLLTVLLKPDMYVVDLNLKVVYQLNPQFPHHTVSFVVDFLQEILQRRLGILLDYLLLEMDVLEIPLSLGLVLEL